MPYIKKVQVGTNPDGSPKYEYQESTSGGNTVSYSDAEGNQKTADIDTSQGRAQYSEYILGSNLSDEEKAKSMALLYPQNSGTDTLNKKGQRIDRIGTSETGSAFTGFYTGSGKTSTPRTKEQAEADNPYYKEQTAEAGASFNPDANYIQMLNDQLANETAAKNKALEEVKNVSKTAMKGLEAFKIQTRDDFANLAEGLGDKFSELRSVMGDYGEAKSVAFSSPDFQQEAQKISQLEDPKERIDAYTDLVARYSFTKEGTTPTEPVATETTPISPTEPMATPTTTKERVALATGNPTLSNEVATFEKKKKETEVIPTAITTPYEFSLSDLDFTDTTDTSSAGIVARYLKTMVESYPEKLIGAQISAQEANDKVNQLKNTITRLEARGEAIKQSTAQQLIALNGRAQATAGVADEMRKLQNAEYNRQKELLEENRARELETLEEERDHLESSLKAQVAFGMIPDGSYFVGKLTALSTKYTEAVRQTNAGYDDIGAQMLYDQNVALLSYSQQISDITWNLQENTQAIMENYNTQIDALDERIDLTESEIAAKKTEAQKSFYASIQDVILQEREKTEEETKATQAKITAEQKAYYDYYGYAYYESGGEVNLLVDNNGNPLQSIEKAKDQLAFFEEMDLPKKEEYVNSWALKWKSVATLKKNMGQITNEQYESIVQYIEDVKKSEIAIAYSERVYSEGYEGGKISQYSASKVDDYLSDPTSVPDLLSGNCVFFTRSIIPDLPYGLDTLEDKMTMAGYKGRESGAMPQEGGVAIIDTGTVEGHVAVITNINQDGTITIAESNMRKLYGGNGVGSRTGTPDELGVVGYWSGSTPQLPTDVQLIVDTAENVASVTKQLKDAGLDSYNRVATAAFNTKTKEKLDFENSKVFREARSTAEKLMGGTRMSDEENKKLRDDMYFIVSNGGGHDEALDFATGVRVQNEADKPLARGLRRIIFGTGQGTASEKTETMTLLSQDLNGGNKDYAIQEAERIALEKKAKLNADDQYKAEKLTGLMDEAISLVKENPKLTGFYDGGIFNITKGVKGDYEKQRLAYLLTEIYAVKRNEIAGTAITNSENSFLKDLVGTVADPDQNFLAKLEGAKSTAIKERNAARAKAGLATAEGRFPTNDEKIAHFERIGGGQKTTEAPSFLQDYDAEFEERKINQPASIDELLSLFE